ncbi:MAG: hypothetical protein J0I33_02020 [Microbacterium ginsengisoli]|uniref:hypothetical protein n=1 Tax=Microbacterium TaxID=33882 RepID=UPI0006FDE523|nr:MULTISPECIES: hypothetical protein [unclassified Microbacterium]MBN9197402.1 hypothetical protein [Microbacterium ginsengisoli]KQR93097.1 hypothetical protein ASG00_02440 [Microbacterium sp. Leaf351]KQS05519.1 hypothetical protein ASF93_00785 [Microbacterium sp. Leaf347]ODU78415.1 MAG: hypothetical protein ABT08_04120 [Microbacterium sp. SCN 71-21]OJU77315.1 MAG: hypothetical protein BGO15_07585 [Microbacterium sp. 71-23]
MGEHEASDRRGLGGVIWAWIWTAVAGAVALPLWAVSGLTQGACYDSSVPGRSYCTSGPVLGAPATAVLWTLWAIAVAACLVIAIRTTRTRLCEA